MAALLPPAFYQRDALDVAKDLLGATLHHGDVRLRITEVEAYRFPDDSANHCHRGHTARNAPMWGPAGHLYVYLCYGIHHLVNIVTNTKGEGAAVLIRSCEPVSGLQTILKRRNQIQGPALLTGPGKVGAALGVDTSWSNHCVYKKGGITIQRGDQPNRIISGPRVGIDYAEPKHIRAPWRLAIADSPWVSHRRTLNKKRK